MAMISEPIRLNHGAAYDRFTGVWSRLAGQDFLDWIAHRSPACALWMRAVAMAPSRN